MDKKVYRSRHARILLVLALFCSIVMSTNVGAFSAYDNAVKRTNSLKVESTSGEVDVTKSYAALMASACGSTYYNNFASTVNNGGDWAIINFDEGSGKRIRIVWSPIANSLTAQFGSDSPSVQYAYLSGSMGYAQFGQYSHNNVPVCDYATLPTTLTNVMLSISTFAQDEGIAANTYAVNYPSGYEGILVPDTSIDNDGDGLSDYVESQWHLGREDIFCGSQCAYPNPTINDLYVENDWMDSGTTEYKPSSTQLDLVVDAFEAKGIKLHVDTGQYGGGNQLVAYEEELRIQPTVDETDFFDLKNGDGINASNFSEARRDIWRYLVTGNKRDTASSGGTYTGTGNIFVAIGRVKELNPTGQNQAIAGTIIHELGHSLCLSDDLDYLDQDPACLFAGIDNYNASSDYDSSMNYHKQFSMVNYSNGLNGTNDHDDWSAILVGMDDFVGKVDPTESSSRRGIIEQEPED